MFETPWFLQSKTTEVGRVNKLVEDRLQRSITELNMKQRKSVEKIDRQIDVVKKELKDIRINIDFSSDLDINGMRVGDGMLSKEQRSNSLSKLDKKKRKKHKKVKPIESQSAPVSVLANENDRQEQYSLESRKEMEKRTPTIIETTPIKIEKPKDELPTFKITRERSYLPKRSKERDRKTPAKRRVKKRKHPLERPHTEMNGFLPAIFNEQTAVEFYSSEKNEQKQETQMKDSKELRLIAIVRQANRSSTPKLRRVNTFHPKSRKHYAFNESAS